VTRCVLSFFVSGLVLACGVAVSWLQSKNYETAARLDRLQMQSEWHERECSALRARLDRFDFTAGVEETPPDAKRQRGDLQQ
jgi:hypothetical protein